MSEGLKELIAEARDVAKWFRGERSVVVNVHDARFETLLDRLADALSAQGSGEPVKMILFCPACGLQHVDEPEPALSQHGGFLPPEPGADEWTNPPHRSHLCHGCGHIWRPADVPTEGVASIATVGKNDSPPPAPQPSADIERLERIADHFEHVAHIARLNALDAEAGKNIPQEVSADYGKRAAASYREQATDHEANAAAIRSAISSQTSPQGKQNK